MTVHRPLTALLLSLALAAGLGACGETKVTTETTARGEKNEGTAVTLKAALTGAEEVPGPGANPAVGAAQVEVSGTRICPDLNVTMGEKPTAAHIHQGAKGTSGPVFIDLQPEFTPGESAFTSKKCVDVPADKAAALISNPSGYYLNVHSAEHPNGAVRGQLDKF
jgi:hypothetical protein